MNSSLRRPLEDLMSDYGNNLERELELESQMVAIGRDQVRRQLEKARESGNESGTRYGKGLIAMAVPPVAEDVDAFIAKASKGGAGRRHTAVKYLRQVDAEVAAFIAMRVVVDNLTGTQRRGLQRLAVMIGSRVEDEARFAAFEEADKKRYKQGLERAKQASAYHRRKATLAGYDRRFNDQEWDAWGEDAKLQTGMALIDMITRTDLVEVGEEIVSRTKTHKVVTPTAKLLEWIERETDLSEALSPHYMPMIVKPLDWTDPFNGGYLTRDTQGRNVLVKTGNRNYLTELADHADQMPMVYDAVNKLQSTRWQINRRVYYTLKELWDVGHDRGGLPSREDIGAVPCPHCGAAITLAKLNTRHNAEHECFASPEVVKEWKREAFKTHQRNVSLRSKRLHVAKTLKVASRFVEEDAIYFPYQLDFRGRVYCIPSFNPQGNDVTKGLLTFADGKPIEDGVAAGWLAIHGANVWGFDKASLEDRIQWVEDHEAEIVAVAADPVSNLMWADADKPFQFLAFCFEWAGFCAEGYGYVSTMPVALDGSCSGIQHFSAMLRDPIGGNAVNLVPADVPQDIYQQVCDKVVEKLKADAGQLVDTIAIVTSSGPEGEGVSPPEEGTVDNYSYAIGWLAIGPNRKTTKRQVMTLPYGSTRFSCREYTEVWLKEKLEAGAQEPWPESERFKAVQYLSDLIWTSIGEVVVAATVAMGWLKKCAKVVADEDLPVYWTTPVGFRVMQHYKNFKARRITTKLGDTTVKLSMQEETDTMDKRRMQNAISPNFVHSMDATHLVMSVCYATNNGIDSFAMIHDSFGTHAADTNMLAACLREAFVDLYTDLDVLEDFRNQIARQVATDKQDKVPATPSRGTLDIEAVRGSDFFFA